MTRADMEILRSREARHAQRVPVSVLHDLPVDANAHQGEHHLELLKPDPEDEYGNDEARKSLRRRGSWLAPRSGRTRTSWAARTTRTWILPASATPPTAASSSLSRNFSRCGTAAGQGVVILDKRAAAHRARKVSHPAGYVYARLGGSTAGKDRQKLVDDFNASESLFVFLIHGRRRGRVEHNIGESSRHLRPQLEPGEGRTGADRRTASGRGARRRVPPLAAGTIEEMVHQRQVYSSSPTAVDARRAVYFEGCRAISSTRASSSACPTCTTLANEEITRMQSLVDRERRSAAEYAFEIKSAAEIEGAARASGG